MRRHSAHLLSQRHKVGQPQRGRLPCALPETLMEKRESAQGPARKDLGLVHSLLIHWLLSWLQVYIHWMQIMKPSPLSQGLRGLYRWEACSSPGSTPLQTQGGLFHCRGLGITPEFLTQQVRGSVPRIYISCKAPQAGSSKATLRTALLAPRSHLLQTIVLKVWPPD